MVKVVVLGGGVAGLSAAHELVERGFSVEVYDRHEIPGGKARSVPVEDSSTEGRPDLPGEHGFRFFPGFYKHVVDTMKRIPFEEQPRGVYGNLTPTTAMDLTLFDSEPVVMPVDVPLSLNSWVTDFAEALHDIFDTTTGITLEDTEFFAGKIWQLISSCEARRLNEYEQLGWWQFMDADNRSDAFKNIFVYGITRSLVAAKANLASTKTVGDIFVQLILNTIDPLAETDRVLNGPTNMVWIYPWLDYLRSKGVLYESAAEVTAIHCDGHRITGATVKTKDGEIEVSGDYYIAAFPVEVMARFIQQTPALLQADATFSDIVALSSNVSWMNGAQFYLKRDVQVCRGHVIYASSPWALTSISQHQFWKNFDFSKYGDGTVHGILSVDISEWDVPGIIKWGADGKPDPNGKFKIAKECTREQVKAEVWEQVKKSLNHAETLISDDDLHSWHLDSDIVFSDEQQAALPEHAGDSLSAQSQSPKTSNREPLLVNLVHTWNLRPQAHTALPNLFLASDYVQTYTDLATMEGANEAARRAVNCIIDRSGVFAAPCRLWKLHEPILFAPLRLMDQSRFEMGLPWMSPSLVRTLRSETAELMQGAKDELHHVEEVVGKLEDATKKLIDKVL